VPRTLVAGCVQLWIVFSVLGIPVWLNGGQKVSIWFVLGTTALLALLCSGLALGAVHVIDRLERRADR
jgi:hypothetical protein